MQSADCVHLCRYNFVFHVGVTIVTQVHCYRVFLSSMKIIVSLQLSKRSVLLINKIFSIFSISVGFKINILCFTLLGCDGGQHEKDHHCR